MAVTEKELFINLFVDKTPLYQLGYTIRQAEFAASILRLIEGGGKVSTRLKNNHGSIMIPFGQKANVSGDKVTKILEANKLLEVSGQFAWQPS